MEAYRSFLPDFNYFQKNIPCQSACPVRTDARAYVNAIANGEYERAYLIARETNPFASTCGWVCGAPCEAACRRGKIDAPVAIRALKRFVNDRHGVYLGEKGIAHQAPAWPAYVGKTGSFDLGNSILPTSRSGLVATSQRGDKTGKRVAIVGAGPSGLSCAHDLALMGHDVVIFDSAPVAGGMLRLGIPEYRLPREVIELEIQAILALGPELKLNSALGKDYSLQSLRDEFDAVFLAIGTYQSRMLNIEGEQFDGVLRAVDFLINVNLGGYNLDLGKRVVVIGGGNVAMDVARTAARLGHKSESGGDLEVALDVARTAIRLGSTEEVHCLVVEDRSEMMADAIEIEEAVEEGVIVHNHVAPKRIIAENGHATAIEMLKVERAFDDDGRFNPQMIPNSELLQECDSVIIAIGQSGELDWIKPQDGLEVARGGILKVDPETMATTAAGVFSGGDIAFGPRLIVNAVADGQRAALNIHAYLQDLEPHLVRKGFFTPVAKSDYPKVGPLRNYLRMTRKSPAALPVDRRIGVSLVEVGFEQAEARTQGARCLVCSINPIFDGELCIMCNGCVDVCPTDCLKMVPSTEIEVDDQFVEFITGESTDEEDYTVMLFDPARCVRCGLCASRCPTEAVRMETFAFSEEIVFQDKQNEMVKP
ncbi:MAG: FAD-dependent oxidoreductase [Chloroflexota bacterium]